MPKITITAEYINARRLGVQGTWPGMPDERRRRIEADHGANLSDLLDGFREPLFAAFDAVNGKASSFTLSGYDALHAVLEAEKILIDKGVPKGARGGAVYTVASAGPAANAYKHAAIGTRFSLRRTGKGDWVLASVERIDVWPRQAARRVLTVSPAARDAIIRHALAGIESHDEARQIAA